MSGAPPAEVAAPLAAEPSLPRAGLTVAPAMAAAADLGADPDLRPDASYGRPGENTVAPSPRLTVDSSSLSGASLTTEPAQGPFYLVLGQGYDPRWVASIDGQPLGPPRVLDGYSVGWRVSDPRGHRVTVSFGPQRWATLSLLASLAGLALVLALLPVPLWWRRRPGGERP